MALAFQIGLENCNADGRTEAIVVTVSTGWLYVHAALLLAVGQDVHSQSGY